MATPQFSNIKEIKSACGIIRYRTRRMKNSPSL
uniref:Uncharacterized protein n=1 Tax=Candidatus Kentrum sp. TUN TaxID=2126343 RepID=A0A450ZUU8_9GAMM|nr:MAG: hypothetical protein BECKTUN1418D_GA0071000_10653 [Candidatus Kentron sp. TUN]